MGRADFAVISPWRKNRVNLAASMRPTSFADLFDNAPGLVVVLAGPDHVIEYANPAYCEFAGRVDLVGQRYRDARPGPTLQATLDRLDRVFRSGEAFIGRALPSTVPRPDGTSEVRYFDYVYQPLVGADGRTEGIIGQAQDVTERVLAHQALAATEERLELAVRASAIGVWEWRLDTNAMIYSAEARVICGFDPDEPVTLDMVVAATHPEDLPQTMAQSGRARDPAIRDTAPYEYRIVRPDGVQRWVLANGRAVFEESASGETVATRYVGTILDITERKLAEERTVLLAHEVDHRARNLMSVIQGTVRLSSANSARDLRKGLTGRINALARAHQLLAESRWRGADLRRLIEEELLPFCLGDDSRCHISGPDAALPPSGAQALAMAVHELATNAAKYGALSIPGGVVAVDWSVEAGHLTICWRERGGPRVSLPSREGFGATLLARALAGVPGGKTRLDWNPGGLQADLELDLQRPDAA
jgi:PAS domain S-box-containing protein